MTETDLDRIEAALRVRLPPEYRATLLDYPLPPDPDSSGLWLVDDATDVIESTRHFRVSPPASGNWSDNYLYLGSDGGEEAYFLDLGRTPATVLTYEHETGRLRSEAPDLATWIQTLRVAFTEVQDDARSMAARRRDKPWWAFWR